MLILDVRKLAVRRRELSLAASMAERLAAVAGYARRGAETLAQVWKGAVEGFANKMRGLAEAIEAYSVEDDKSIHQELLLTCCTGNPSDALHMFLMKQTSVQQLTRLERGLMQALEYATLVVSTRLQVASQHLITVLHEMQACASWEQKFKAVGLELGPLRELMAQAQEFNKLGELLLIECSQARRFVRTLFQVLLRLAHKLADGGASASEASQVASIGAPTREDLDMFISRLRGRSSLELAEVTGRIGSVAPRTDAAAATTAAAGTAAAAAVPGSAKDSGGRKTATACASLVDAAHRLVADAGRVGERINAAVSSRAGVLACLPVYAPSPWASLTLPELRTVASNDAANGVPSPRGLGHTTVSLMWEAPEENMNARLLVLWSGGGGRQSELHVCRAQVPAAPPGAPAPVQLERLRLRAGRLFPSSGVHHDGSHILLCQMYDASRVAALLLQERTSAGGAATAVCLVDISECDFHPVTTLDTAEVEQSSALPPAACLEDLSDGSIRRSAPLPDGYVWASALCSMAARSVCSVYACRSRRLLTLDMEVEGEEDDDEENAAAG